MWSILHGQSKILIDIIIINENYTWKGLNVLKIKFY